MMLTENVGKSNGLLTLLTIFLMTFSIYADFGIRRSYGYLAILAVAVFLIALNKYIRPFSRFKTCYWLFVLPCVLFSILPSSYRSDNTIAISIYMIVAGFFVTCAQVNQKEGRRVLWIIDIASIVLSLYIIAVKAIPSLYWNGVTRFISSYSQEAAKDLAAQGYGIPIGDSITFADYVIVMAMLSRLSRVIFLKIKPGIGFYIFSAVNIVAMFFENRRSEILCLVVVVFFFFLLSLDPHRMKEVMKKLFLLVVAAALIVFAFYILYKNGGLGRYEGIIQKYIMKEASGQDVSGGRLDLWDTAWHLFLERPLFGIGWERFMGYNTYHHDVHNTYLQWLCETGVVGFVLIFVPMFILLGMSYRCVKKICKDKNADVTLTAMACVGFGTQLFFFVINIIDPAFYHLNYFCFFGIALILSECSYKLYSESL
ncbi:MAG: O-antigen ligase family protein [Lachnospiraceae bacterium]|nr:O-antigen ligase family protein [Lachnospiraceae bacterium]